MKFWRKQMPNDLLNGDPAKKPQPAAKPAEPNFSPIEFFPPGSTSDDVPTPSPATAKSESEAKWFRDRGWVIEEKFRAAERERERLAAEAALKAEEKAAAERADLEREEERCRVAAAE